MTWFFIALIAPALWSVTNHIDKYLLERFCKGTGPGALIVFSSLIGAFVMPFIPIFERGIFDVTFLQIFTLILAAVSFLAGVLLYLHALQKDETSTVVPLFQMIPVWGFALAWMFLGETLSAYQIVGSALVIAGGVTISLALEERRVRFKKAIFFLMATEAFLAALGGLLFKTVALETGYWVATFWNLVGFVAVALFVLSFIAPYRRQFVDLVRANTVPILGLNALNEGLSMIGGLAFSFAFLLAPLALVQTVNGFQPLFVLLYGIVLTLFFPQLGTESLVRRHIFQKVGAIAIMLFGAYMVNGGF